MDKNTWTKVKTIYLDAVELPENERKDYINSLCDDSELKEEIYSLLSANDVADDFLDIASLPKDALIENDNFFIGKFFGRYKIIKLIAQGGMGLVYFGLRDDEVKQKAAVKIINPGYASSTVIKRFQTERQTLANLNHPNISKLLDGGITDDGIQFLVMEFIDGIPVDEYCDEHKLNIKERLKLFLKIADVVKYAHHNLVVHRDLKPNNILITKEGEPKLLDFGIAKILDPEGMTHETITSKGILNFTPEYASPEQIKGEIITTSSDVYSLGIVLYKLLTGHHPYKLKSHFPSDIKDSVLHAEPTKPSEIIYETVEKKYDEKVITISPETVSSTREGSIEKLHKKLIGDLDNIVAMSIRKEAERRYSSVENFAEDIKRYLNDQPVNAHKDSLSYRSKKFVKRNKTAVITFAIINIFIILGLGGIIWQSRIASIERDNAKLEAEKANQIKSFLLNMISSPDPKQDGREVKVIDAIQKAAKSLSTELQGQKQIEAEIRTIIGTTYQNLGIYDSAEVEMNKALDINQKLFGEKSYETAVSLKNLGVVLEYKGDYESTEKLYRKSLDMLKSVEDKPSLELAKMLDSYGSLFTDMGNYQKAEEVSYEALLTAEKVRGDDDYDVISIKNNLATALNYNGKLDKADSLYRVCLKAFRKKFGNNHIRVSNVLNNLAFISIYKQEHHKALPLLEESINIKKKILGEDHPDLILAYSNLGSTYFNDSQFVKAEEIIKASVDVGLKNFDENNVNLSRSYMWYGRALAANGKFKDGINFLSKSYSIRKKEFGQNNKLTLTVEMQLGKCLLNAKQFSEAENHLLKSYQGLNEKYGEEDRTTKLALSALVDLYKNWGKPNKAAQLSRLME